MQDKLQELLDRLDANLEDFRKTWESSDKAKLIDGSREITAIRDAHYYLTESHGFEPEEIDYLLLFENPLQVVADKWLERTEDLSDFSFALDEVFDKQDALRDYERKEKPSVLEQLRKAPGLTPEPREKSAPAKEAR
ncbi:hypothetical protein [Ethanoligenens harbinense]|uniref:DUF3848 domain-containing protein n=1 Tax=Ethanoligenens harbinense (strain DSM 18485 / JCM 12961 / CGMCC 1.5033 / YUAN-3) TaxID=663278 RepID=E6UA56_ETHHY|nr:hypothetical protein [Ethanoligenens harbinense]ADU27417.1 hypothetical protein Ethha_1895 [Ethanoligenens harbinense YUAN-3]AVQ96475.1 hypothetical protein CXQ68_09700 [Ethanoligenens harbinense YUAN-3]AYF39134.1 hypothetical protein CXP51_09570 [Ethanoligenens harbinense]AYF41960.1 hypothetical protein CN246_10140 [Ethanoligenens harbinense]QCN92716.1 hypothetical protein DRA42_09730 [Ethanoligenens harbinense]